MESGTAEPRSTTGPGSLTDKDQGDRQGGPKHTAPASGLGDGRRPADGKVQSDGATRPPTDDSARDLADEDFRSYAQARQQVNTEFSGSVVMNNPIIGISNGMKISHATGVLTESQLDDALRHYLRPAPYGDARAVLAERNAVVLTGAEGTGKRVGALALLRDLVPGGLTEGRAARSMHSLHPTITIAELAAHQFRRGHGYLVQDWIGATGTASEQRFDVEGLRHALTKVGAYLVITATTAAPERMPLHALTVGWKPPDPVGLFDHLLSSRGIDGLGAADLDRVRAVLGQSLPREIFEAVNRLSDGVDAALDALDDAERRTVAGWFDAEPDWRSLLPVVTVAFGHGLPERTVERLHARLEGQVGSSQSPTERAGPAPQTRARIAAAGSLVTAVPDRIGSSRLGSERRLTFPSASVHSLVIHELVSRYGHELWEPVQHWIDEIARENPADTQVSLTLGVALLAREAPTDVEESYLDRWAAGTMPERLTASTTLWWMCFDDTLAPVALRIALGWAKSKGNKAAAAADALGGGLGLRYPREALRWLWMLSGRDALAGRIARYSIGSLFSASQDQDGRERVLRFVANQVRRAVNEPGRYQRALAARRTATELLGAREWDTGDPVPAAVLRARPDMSGDLGDLWAESLRSAACRADAARALRRTLYGLAADPRSGELAAALGAAIGSGLDDAEVGLVRRVLDIELHRGGSDRLATVAIVTALLAALRRSGSRAGATISIRGSQIT